MLRNVFYSLLIIAALFAVFSYLDGLSPVSQALKIKADVAPRQRVKHIPGDERKGTVLYEQYYNADEKVTEMRVKFVDGVESTVHYDSLGRPVQVREIGATHTAFRNTGIIYNLNPPKRSPNSIRTYQDNGALWEEIKLAADGSKEVTRYSFDGKTLLQTLKISVDGSYEIASYADNGIDRQSVFRRLGNGLFANEFYEGNVLRCVVKGKPLLPVDRQETPLKTGHIDYYREDGKTLLYSVDDVNLRGDYNLLGGPITIKEFYPDGKTLRRRFYSSYLSNYRPEEEYYPRIGEVFNREGVMTERLCLSDYDVIKVVQTVDKDGKVIHEQKETRTDKELSAFVDYLLKNEVSTCFGQLLFREMIGYPEEPPVNIDLSHLEQALNSP
ncbi:MAG: hypothetical protein K2W82_10640 [Candidatus Obscuribacterales bacterium]|nr:hypothetical protein [Candidatus Obscuribacterales bacterium]